MSEIALDGEVTDLLDGALPRVLPHYEDRPAQREMARAVARTLADGGALLVEAPTGVGKSLAYLLPAALHAAQGEGAVIVSTYTKALQDQLVDDDLPIVERALGRRVDAAVLRGRGNYLCLMRWNAAAAGDGDRFHPLARWVETTRTGYAGELPGLSLGAFSADVPAAICQSCSLAAPCFLLAARRRAFRARLVIVNHALLLADIVSGGAVLPPAEVLVLDEAHRLGDAARAAWRVALAREGAEPLFRAFAGDGRHGGTLALVRRLARRAGRHAAGANIVGAADRAARHMAEAVTALERFEAALGARLAAAGVALSPDAPRVRLRPAGTGRVLTGPRGHATLIAFPEDEGAEVLAALGVVPPEIARVREHAEDLGRGVEDAGGVQVELAAAEEAWTRLLDAARGTLEQRDGAAVRWVERASGAAGSPGGAVLVSVPADASSRLGAALASRFRAIVLTSATLAPGGDFTFPLAETGLARSGLSIESRRLASPFPLPRMLRAFAPGAGPLPGTPGHEDALAAALARLVTTTERNTLVLCTSYATVRALADRLRPVAVERGFPLHVQGEDGAARLVVERFRRSRGGLLVGTTSLWEGVDLPGPECEIAVLARLPFAVPTDPLVEAAAERVADDGGDPFEALHLPQALLRLVQGAGRVIRRATDRGAVLVADPRIWSRAYGAAFRAALPVTTISCADLDDMTERAARWLEEAA